MTKQQRKKLKKQKGKDKILVGKPSAAVLRHLNMGGLNTDSKKIKKGGPGGSGFKKKHVITDREVKMKAKAHRLVVPTSKLK